MKKSILIEKKNCWRKTQVEQAAFLIDAGNYYKAFFNVAERAKSSIVVAGWEMDARLGLKAANSAIYPNNLRTYFKKLTKKSETLKIYALCWKPALYLKFEREMFAPMKWKKLGKRLFYKQDKTPFIFGSYHEKISIIDGQCAFLGGIDLTKRKWDTQDHSPHNTKRVDGNGSPYCPVHDLQLALTGKIVEDLQDALKERFTNSFGDVKQRPSDTPLWPGTHPPQLKNAQAAIARTWNSDQAFEIERFYLDAIKAAKDRIYIENQYFSHDGIVEALAARLKEPDGPEVVVVLPIYYPGFFERAIFIKARNRVIKRLKRADQNGRFRVFYPSLPNENPSNFIVVHSKLLVVDQNLMTLGSANLNWRSMRVDSEINFCLEAGENKEAPRFINGVVKDLLSEHLSVSIHEFDAKFEKSKSLIETIAFFQGQKSKTLSELPLLDPNFIESCFGFIAPFVDIKRTFPKWIFFLFLAMIFLMLTAVILKASNGL